MIHWLGPNIAIKHDLCSTGASPFLPTNNYPESTLDSAAIKNSKSIIGNIVLPEEIESSEDVRVRILRKQA
jgi:hypothetical protein